MNTQTEDNKIKFDSGHILDQLMSLLGDETTLIPIPQGSKSPVTKGWQNTEKPDYADPKVKNSFHFKNIAVLMGEKSNHLCAIDIDDDGAVEVFMKLNPLLQGTLRTKGARGCQVWVRISGEYSKLTKLKTVDGKDWGEWRADGGLSVIYGKHPSGCWYTILDGTGVSTVRFESIVWPPELHLPWMAEALLEEYDRLVQQAGLPYLGSGRKIHLNQTFFALKFTIEHRLLWEPGENSFYLYNHTSGLWELISTAALKNLINEDFMRSIRDFEEKNLAGLNTNAFLDSVLSMLKGMTLKADVFKNDQRVIRVPNGMLCIACEPPTLYSYHWNYYARNGCGITFDPEAECPQFLNELLSSALDADDILVLQKWMGAVLLGVNPTQSLLVIRGTAGGGKSTLISILERVIGVENTVELRTQNLCDRFETSRFIGKKLLCGKDVASNFLNNKNAGKLKALVGGDTMTAERKNSNQTPGFRGDFNIVVTSNASLQLRLDGDEDAWARRLIIVDYAKAKPKKPIAHFADRLLNMEGPGILNFMIRGAILYLQDVKHNAAYSLTAVQKQRVEDLVHNSDSLRHFVTDNLQPDKDCDVTVAELLQAYENFCIDNGWEDVGHAEFYKKLPKLMLDVYGLKKRNDIEGNMGGAQRGFRGVRIIKGGK